MSWFYVIELVIVIFSGVLLLWVLSNEVFSVVKVWIVFVSVVLELEIVLLCWCFVFCQVFFMILLWVLIMVLVIVVFYFII